MTAATARQRCLDLPGATSDQPFGPETTVFRVGGKIFALCRLDAEAPRMNLKCDPDLAPSLREAYTSVVPGYHMNKRHWNTVELDGDVPDAHLHAMIEDSYDLVVASLSRAIQRSLGWAPAVDRDASSS
jgi:predicted DNA-binding protein (MmcQ/YjbR family)